MHTDENKKFDKRNISINIRTGLITKRDYELYLSKLPDMSDKVFLAEEVSPHSEDLEATSENQVQSRKKKLKKKGKGI